MIVGVKNLHHLSAWFQSLCNHKLSGGFTEHLLCVLPLSLVQTTVINFGFRVKRWAKNAAGPLRTGEINVKIRGSSVPKC